MTTPAPRPDRHPSARRMFGGSALTFLGRVGAAGLGLVATALAARLLGSEDFGLFSLAQSVMSVLWVVGTLGMGASLLQRLPARRHAGGAAAARGTLATSVRTALVLSTAIFVVLAVFRDPIARALGKPEAGIYLAVWAASLPFTSLLRVTNAANQAAFHFAGAVLPDTIVRWGFACLALAGLLALPHVSGALVTGAFVASFAVACAAGWAWLVRSGAYRADAPEAAAPGGREASGDAPTAGAPQPVEPADRMSATLAETTAPDEWGTAAAVGPPAGPRPRAAARALERDETLLRGGAAADPGLLRMSLTFLATALVGTVTAAVAAVVMGRFSPAAEIGWYSAGMRAATLVSFILVSANMVFAPLIASLWAEADVVRLRSLYVRVSRWVLLASTPLCVLLIVGGRPVMRAFGADFAAGALPLAILAAGQLANAATGSVGYMLTMTGHQRWQLWNSLAGLIAVLGLALWLVPGLGATGAAIASAGGLALGNALAVLEVRRLVGATPFAARTLGVLPAGVASALAGHFVARAMAGASWPLALLATGAAVGVVYAALALPLGTTREDRTLLVGMLGGGRARSR